MHEILKKLLESQVLSEETKTELTEAWDIALQKFTEDKTAEIKTELVEQFVAERAELTDKIQTFVEQRMESEIVELSNELVGYKDQEVEYAAKLAEEKQDIALKLAEEIDSLVDKLNAFLEERIELEVSELTEDIQEAQKHAFGKKIFESFRSEFSKFAETDEAALEGKIARLEDVVASLRESLSDEQNKNEKIVREAKMEKVLGSLSGVKRDQMSILLSSVPTEKLEESYTTYIGKVLKEESSQNTAKTVIAESKQNTRVATGDAEEAEQKTTVVINEAVDRMKKLAGIA